MGLENLNPAADQRAISTNVERRREGFGVNRTNRPKKPRRVGISETWRAADTGLETGTIAVVMTLLTGDAGDSEHLPVLDCP